LRIQSNATSNDPSQEPEKKRKENPATCYMIQKPNFHWTGIQTTAKLGFSVETSFKARSG
jgi:hypothetical protein